MAGEHRPGALSALNNVNAGKETVDRFLNNVRKPKDKNDAGGEHKSGHRARHDRQETGRGAAAGGEDETTGNDGGEGKKNPEQKKNGETKEQSGQTAEKYEITNQAEINEARERREAAEIKRKEIMRTVESSLAVIDSCLKKGKLNPDQKKRYEWLRKAVTNAKEKSWDQHHDKYKVELENGQSRLEGLPVEELYNAMEEQKARTQREVQQVSSELATMRTLQTECERASAGAGLAGDENSTKLAYFDVYSKLNPDNPLRKQAENKVAGWQVNDAPYSDEERKYQLGEATRTIVNEQLQQKKERDAQIAKGEKNLENKQGNLNYLNHVSDLLKANSLPYFDSHYGKGKTEGSFSPEDQKTQHLYTEREANLISKDGEYKDVIVERYTVSKKLPDGYDNMSEDQQNYELAKLALRDRMLLKMPDRVEVPLPVKKLIEIKKEKTSTDIKPVLEKRVKIIDTVNDGNGTHVPVGPVNGPTNSPEVVTIPAQPERLTSIDAKTFLIDETAIAKAMAGRVAEERWNRRVKDGEKAGFFGRIANKMKKGLTEDYWKATYYKEALDAIEQNGNLMEVMKSRIRGEKGVTEANLPGMEDYYKVMDATVEQYKEQLVDSQKEIGEKIIDDDTVKAAVAELLYNHAMGKFGEISGYQGLDERAAIERFVQKEIVPLMANKKFVQDGSKRGDEQKGLLYGSNFYDLAVKYKEDITKEVERVKKENPEQEKNIRGHLAGMMKLDLQLGMKERDLMNDKPKGVIARYDKMMQWGKTHRVLGRIVTNPMVIGAAASIGTQLATRGGRWALIGGAAAFGAASGFWIPLGAGAIAGGAVRYFKRGRQVESDIAQERRHETLGGKGSTILEQGGGLRYGEVISYKDATDQITAVNGKTLDEMGPADRNALGMIWARINIGKEHHVDYFKLDETEGRQYGTTMVAHTALLKALKVVQKDSGLNESQFNQMLNEFAVPFQQDLASNVEEVDKKQKSYKRWQQFHSAWKGAAMGVAGGAIIHGAMEYAQTGDAFGIGAGIHKAGEYWNGRNTPPISMPHPHIPHVDLSPGAPGTHTDFNSPDYWNHHGFHTGHLKHVDMHHGMEAGTGPAEDFPGSGHHAGGEMTGRLMSHDGKVSAGFGKMIENLKHHLDSGENIDATADPRIDHLIKDLMNQPGFNGMSDADITKYFQDNMHVHIFPTQALSHSHDYAYEGGLDSHSNVEFPDDVRRQFLDAAGQPKNGVVMTWDFKTPDGVTHTIASIKGHGTSMEGFVEKPLGDGLVASKPDGIHYTQMDNSPVGKVSTPGMEKIGYDPAIATVPWARPVKHRPGEKGYDKEAKKIKEEKERKEKAKHKPEKKKDGHAKGHDHDKGHAHAEHKAEGSGGGEPKPKELSAREKLQHEFAEAKAAQDKYLDKGEMVKLDEKYKKLPKEEQEKVKIDAPTLAYLSLGKKDKWFRREKVTGSKEDKDIRDLGFKVGDKVPSLADYVKEAKKKEKVVKEHEEKEAAKKAKVEAEKESQKKNEGAVKEKLDKGDAAAKEVKKAVEADKEEDAKAAKKKFKEATGVDYWDDYTKDGLKEKLEGGASPKQEKNTKTPRPDVEKNRSEDSEPKETKGDDGMRDIMKAGDKLIEKWGHKIHFKLGSLTEDDRKKNKNGIVKVIENLGKVLENADKQSVEKLLNAKGGLDIKFELSGRPTIRNQELTLPVDARYKGIEEALEKRLPKPQQNKKAA
jgi:hypothetical protein